MPPWELDEIRACNDDRDLECVMRLGEELVGRYPDEPVLHLMLANTTLDLGGDLRAAALELLEWAEAFGQSPGQQALVRICWRFVAFRQRVESALPSSELAAERAAILDDLSRFEPESTSQEARALLLALAVRVVCEQSPARFGVAAALRLEEIADPTTIYPLAMGLSPSAERDPEIRAVQRRLIDILLASDPLSPRYPAYLLLDARARPTPEAKPAIRALIAQGLPAFLEDDAWVRYAWIHQRRTLPREARDVLTQIVNDERQRSSTFHALIVLAAEEEASGNPYAALQTVESVTARYGMKEPELAIRKAELLAKIGQHREALIILQDSLLQGGPDYSRWYLVGREHQLLGNEPEAVRLYQYYLVQLGERATEAMPFSEPPASARAALEARGTVWYRIVEMHPGFFGRSGFRQFVEMLALLAAGLLTAARARRARAFLLPGALAAEIVFFAGLVSLRGLADGAGVPGLSWVWLGTASLRTFVLVTGGLYLSAIAGLPRHTRAIAGPVIAAGIAAIAGLAIGLAHPPLFVFEALPGFARVAELGLAPERASEIPALIITALRVEGAARLVWPALVLTALPTDGLFALPLFRLGSFAPRMRDALAVAVSALLCSAGSPGLFPLAVLGAALLCVARIRWGAAVPFLLHTAFALSAAFAARVVAT